MKKSKFRWMALILIISILGLVAGCAMSERDVDKKDMAFGGLFIGGLLSFYINKQRSEIEGITPATPSTTTPAPSPQPILPSEYNISNFRIFDIAGPSDKTVSKDGSSTKYTRFIGMISNGNSTDNIFWYKVKFYNSRLELIAEDSYRQVYAVPAAATIPFEILYPFKDNISAIEIIDLTNIETVQPESGSSFNLKIYNVIQQESTITGKVYNLSDDSITNLVVMIPFYNKDGTLLDVREEIIDSLDSKSETNFSITSSSAFDYYGEPITTYKPDTQ